ncbi:hypothetical protein GWG65_37635 [Bradyrhizobium sp. CSA207]|uniref:hypothetical protein n=1 Tax=Bradyrhizobium sp. CSA207 TaxID=2698826 RepID=UPI0023B02F5A|nr:hypothetical protein [Bradyrhizobium sp. CSA207]MDE5446959.1 hypothetical protein [Bradyrhizobium sp. CSA207]
MSDKFLIVFFTTVALTLVCGCAAASVVVFGHDPGPPMMTELYNTALKLFTAGVGAIIGLVGGSKLT